MDNAAIAIATISAVATLIGGGFATYQQLRKDARTNNVELIRLQEDMEKDLWERMKLEFASMQSRLDRQDSTIAEQGALIMQLRDRVKQLESENGILKDENERLRKGSQGKMNL